MTTVEPAGLPLGTILCDPGTGRMAVRFQVDDTTGAGMHAWYVPAADPADARVLHHVEVTGWQEVELPPGVAEVVRAVLERESKLAAANGQNARFWADHFDEVQQANRQALGEHHKPGHTVAELITKLVKRVAAAEQNGEQ